MSKYNFDEIVNRRDTWSEKWNVADNELPMWVADMDFKTAPEIREAFLRRLTVGAYGYTCIPEAWYDAYIGWWERRHHLTMTREELIFSTGVVPTISSIVRKLTTPGEKVLIQTPVYNVFYNSILNNGAHVVESPLLLTEDRYSMDFEDLERKLADPQTVLMLLCNPHNPVGRIWSAEELSKVGELCSKYHVTVVSDEIHCDLTDPDKEYVPFASVSETCRNISITAVAPSKTFNLAGMQSSAVFVPDEVLRHKVWRGLNTDECGEPNFMAVTAAVAAFNEGEDWLLELQNYIRANKDFAIEYVEKNIPELHVIPSEATYLIWVDCRKLTQGHTDFASFVRKSTGLYISCGAQYGDAGKGFIRINLATPRERVEDGMRRLSLAVTEYPA